MPLLISSAAIQLTFGLENYLLDHFTTIYVLKDNYRYGLYNTPFEGHVSEEVFREYIFPVCHPALLTDQRVENVQDLLSLPLLRDADPLHDWPCNNGN